MLPLYPRSQTGCLHCRWDGQCNDECSHCKARCKQHNSTVLSLETEFQHLTCASPCGVCAPYLKLCRPCLESLTCVRCRRQETTTSPCWLPPPKVGTANLSRHATLCESHKKALNRRDTTLQVPSTEDTPSTTMSATMSRVPRDAAGADTTFIMTSTSAFGNSAARGLRSPIGRPCKGTKESEENGRPATTVLCTRCPSAGTGATQKF